MGRRFKKGFAEPSASSLLAEALAGSSGPDIPGMNAGVAGNGPEGLLGDAPESQIKCGSATLNGLFELPGTTAQTMAAGIV